MNGVFLLFPGCSVFDDCAENSATGWRSINDAAATVRQIPQHRCHGRSVSGGIGELGGGRSGGTHCGPINAERGRIRTLRRQLASTERTPMNAPRLAAVGMLVALAGSGDAAPPKPGSHRMTPVVSAVQRTRPAVVNIHSQKIAPQSSALAGTMNTSGRMSGMGTGVVVDARGYVVTNHHVIEDVTNLRVTTVDGAMYAAEIVARDPQTDLALLLIKPTQPLAVMPLGVSSDVMVGEQVAAIGNAFGYEHTTTVGYISELHRDVKLSDEQSYRNLIQTDAAINPGNSGGPLVNLDGEMIGLNVAIRAGAQNIGFAIPVDDVKQVLTRLMSIQRLRRTYHGVGVKTADPSDLLQGKVVVKRVDPRSPAEAAGLRIDDRILSVDGEPVSAAFDLERLLLDKRAGEAAVVTVIRNGEEKRIPLAIAAAPSRSSDAASIVWRRIGVRLDEVNVATSEVRRVSSAQLKGGMRIVEVAASSPAESAGVHVDDIFVGVHDRETVTIDQVAMMLKQPAAIGDGKVKFWIVRDGKLHYGHMDVPADD
jgi:serine protease Do